MNINKKSLIAVVGVSQNPEKYGHRIFKDLLQNGYTVEGVNPKGGIALSKKLFPTLSDLPSIPKLVIIVVPPQAGLAVLQECAELGISEVWMQPGAESAEALTLADTLGIQLTTACFMVQEGIW